MREDANRYLVDGTSALKPDCSRYSNENEHIIGLPGIVVGESGYQSQESERRLARLRKRVRKAYSESVMINDLREMDIKGTSYGSSRKGAVAAGFAYTFFAIALLYISF